MITILIVDDEPIIRKGLISLIDWQSLGCVISGESQNGLEALSFLQQNHVDIVITDIKMPGMNGLKLAKQIQEKYAGTKVIMLTAYSDFSYAQEAIKASAQDYVIKTNFVEELPNVIRETIKKIKQEKESLKKTDFLSQTNFREFIIRDILSGIVVDEDEIKCKFELLGLSLNNYFIIESECNDSANGIKQTDNLLQINEYAFQRVV